MASSSSVGSRNENWVFRRSLRTRCDCGAYVGKWTSWTDKNPCRRFIGCPNFQDEDKDCRFFAWVDPPLPCQRYKDVLLEYHFNGADGANDLFAEYVPHEGVDVEVANGQVGVAGVGMQGGQVGVAGVGMQGGQVGSVDMKWKIGFFVCLVVIVGMFIKDW